MANDVLMVRVYLSEADHGRRKTLMREILSILHDRHAVQGVTVFRGVAGFGASGEVPTPTTSCGSMSICPW